MRILFVNSISANKFGGGEQWMVKAAKGLMDAGHKVFVASKRGAEILRVAHRAAVPTRVFNIRADFSPLNTWRIARFLTHERIEVLVCNLNKDVRVAGLAARLVHTPAVVARHGVLLCARKWKHKVTLTNLVDSILTNTQSIKQAYDGYGWFGDGFVKVVYNGIEDKSHVPPYDFARDFPGKKVIFSAGRLTPQKGFVDLIRAASRLAEKRRDFALVIAGQGRQEDELKALASSLGLEAVVHFWGFRDTIDPLLKGCDLFVLASHFEGMPNVVMEAMAAGKPVIATDVNGARELMVPESTGRIVPPRDPAALAAAIAALLDDAHLRREFGRQGLQRVQTHFTIPLMVQNLEQYFSSLLNAHEKP